MYSTIQSQEKMAEVLAVIDSVAQPLVHLYIYRDVTVFSTVVIILKTKADDGFVFVWFQWQLIREYIRYVTCLECFAVYKMSYNNHIEVVVVIYQFNAGIIITRYK